MLLARLWLVLIPRIAPRWAFSPPLSRVRERVPAESLTCTRFIQYGSHAGNYLPADSQRNFDRPLTVAEVAASIGKGLAKAALAGEVDGRLVDTSFTIAKDAKLRIITSKDPEGLEILRHSTAHLLAQAVQSIYPKAQVTIGPVIEHGFYYDFAFERPFTPEDLEQFEAKMREFVKADQPVHRRVLSRDAAVQHFRSIGEHYKAEIIAAIPANEEISLYGQGDWEIFAAVRTYHRPASRRIQADEGRGRLLAR